MAQSFKVRLGDGTELAVDHVGLRTWSIDERAVVQTKHGWRPLKDVLAVLDRPQKPDDGVAVIPFKKLDHEPLRPPPSTGELATLKLAEPAGDEPGEDEDLYDDGPSVVGLAWMWTQRVVLLVVVVGGGYLAATTWQVWLPRAGQLGVDALGQIQKYTGGAPPTVAGAAAPDESQAAHAAAQAVAGELPHLAPEAIQLVMSSSLVGVLDAPEVFRRAHDAAERGASALSADETQELRALKATLMQALRPAEREGLQEYERARAFRATLPFEDRAALGSWAHGARTLPERGRDRLRALMGKAIRSGLHAKPASSASTVAAR